MQKLCRFQKLILDTEAALLECLPIIASFHLHLTLIRCFTGSIDSRHHCSWENSKSFSSAPSGRGGTMNFSKYRPVLAQSRNTPIGELKMKKNFTTANWRMPPNGQKHGFPRRFLILECFFHSPAAVTISRIWSTFARQSCQVSRCALLINSYLNFLTPLKRGKSSATISFSFSKWKIGATGGV